MHSPQQLNVDGNRSDPEPLPKGTLFWKYVLLFVVVMSVALITTSLIDIWFIYQEHRAVLIRAQKQQATSAAAKISDFVTDIEAQLGWTTHLSWSVASMEQRELDAIRLLRQVPAITELALWDDKGREQLHVSRQAMDRIGGAVLTFAQFAKGTIALPRAKWRDLHHGPSVPRGILALRACAPD